MCENTLYHDVGLIDNLITGNMSSWYEILVRDGGAHDC